MSNEQKLMTASETIEVLGITDNILRAWSKSGILRPVSETGKRFFKSIHVDRIRGVERTEAKQEKQSIHSILNSTAIKSMLFVNSISTLDERSKKLAMSGNLKDSIKHLVQPEQEVFESLFLALEGLKHESFFWSSLQPIVTDDLDAMIELVESRTGAPVIVIMGGKYNRKLIEVQPDGKVIVFAMNKPSALNVLDNYLKTI